jgi:hypothetical protein
VYLGVNTGVKISSDLIPAKRSHNKNFLYGRYLCIENQLFLNKLYNWAFLSAFTSSDVKSYFFKR